MDNALLKELIKKLDYMDVEMKRLCSLTLLLSIGTTDNTYEASAFEGAIQILDESMSSLHIEIKDIKKIIAKYCTINP